ncbi:MULTISPECIES: toll/interleukin-1 receptor domain-containing protein [Photorhabdus]|uniref:TIR domain-containing protein n=1 Tax=Photorhabdus khanii TaxID=1004150 RepID=A0A7C9KFA2_9GAMM|nr:MULTISPECIES: toll/interleukin-1 receptor domain-containing protein [Photorhabdus]MCA6221860.1 toll/interleukin-1 receptor domain-containing protein [Photorhabdus antumapuensis]MQL46705.1 TIR domain-containing protein [Photorhabdus khanii]
MDDKSNVAVFISYAWGGSLEKKEWVRRHIVNSLNWKYSVFWDRDTIGFGESIDACILKALSQRPVKVFCICDSDYLRSAKTMGSGLYREIQVLEKIAYENDVKIIPLIFEAECIQDLPTPLAGRAYLDLTELHKRNLFLGDAIYALAEGVTQAEMSVWMKKNIAKDDLFRLARRHFQDVEVKIYGNGRTHEVILSPQQPLLPAQWMWNSSEWGYMLSDDNDTFCPAKGRWHWDYSSPSRGMRALGTATMSIFFPEQTTPSDQAALHRAGNVLAQKFFSMIYKHEPFILESEDIIPLLLNDVDGYKTLEFLLKSKNKS